MHTKDTTKNFLLFTFSIVIIILGVLLYSQNKDSDSGIGVGDSCDKNREKDINLVDLSKNQDVKTAIAYIEESYRDNHNRMIESLLDFGFVYYDPRKENENQNNSVIVYERAFELNDPPAIESHGDRYLRTLRIAANHYGLDFSRFRKESPHLYSFYQPQFANLDDDEEQEVIIRYYYASDGFDREIFAGFVILDWEEEYGGVRGRGEYYQYAHRIYAGPYHAKIFIDDYDGDGRDEIALSPLWSIDINKKQARIYDYNGYGEVFEIERRDTL